MLEILFQLNHFSHTSLKPNISEVAFFPHAMVAASLLPSAHVSCRGGWTEPARRAMSSRVGVSALRWAGEWCQCRPQAPRVSPPGSGCSEPPLFVACWEEGGFLSAVWEMKRDSCPSALTVRGSCLTFWGRSFGPGARFSLNRFGELYMRSVVILPLSRVKLRSHCMCTKRMERHIMPVTGDLPPSAGQSRAGCKPLLPQPHQGAARSAWNLRPEESLLRAMRAFWYVELVLWSPSYCPAVPEWSGPKPHMLFSFQRAHLKNRIWQKGLQKNNYELLKSGWWGRLGPHGNRTLYCK